MQKITEEEAKGKACPFAPGEIQLFCIGEQCISWKWDTTFEDRYGGNQDEMSSPRKGHCVPAGREGIKMPVNKHKAENEQLRKEAEDLRREVDRLEMKIKIITEILKGHKGEE